LGGRLSSLQAKSVRAIDREYKSTLTFPVPMFSNVAKAIVQLAKDGLLSVEHRRGSYCHETPDLSETELLDATIGAPFEKPAGPRRPEASVPLSTPPPITSGPAPPPVGVQAPVSPPQQIVVEDVRTLDKLSPGELRQEIAQRLAAQGEATVERAIFRIFLQEESGDLSVFPAALRGGITGPGSLMIEIEIRRTGPLTKGQVEQMAENLPTIARAHYQATLKVATAREDESSHG
jgi:hypothetical protein